MGGHREVSQLPLWKYFLCDHRQQSPDLCVKSAKLDATGHRWVAQLANYHFTLTYCPGSANRTADALSTIKWAEVSSTIVSQMLHARIPDIVPVECFCYGQQAIPDVFTHDCQSSLDTAIDWSMEQEADPVIREVKQKHG